MATAVSRQGCIHAGVKSNCCDERFRYPSRDRIKRAVEDLIALGGLRYIADQIR